MFNVYLWVGVCHEQVLQLLQVWWRGEERLLLANGQAQPARLSKACGSIGHIDVYLLFLIQKQMQGNYVMAWAITYRACTESMPH
jgi:hypothetical protein